MLRLPSRYAIYLGLMATFALAVSPGCSRQPNRPGRVIGPNSTAQEILPNTTVGSNTTATAQFPVDSDFPSDLPVMEPRFESLFDGRTLAGWRIADKFDFKHHGTVRVQTGAVRLEAGEPATGIAYTGEFPRIGYMLRFEAQRVRGSDFFCGLTFPVGDSACTLILGGWGGSVVGLSNVDNQAADENVTTTYMDFENGRWYDVRVRVSRQQIRVFIDGEDVISLATKDHEFSIWPEQEPMLPLGISTWNTTAALRGMRVRAMGGGQGASSRVGREPSEWTNMLAGDDLGGWKVTQFGGQGEITIKDGLLTLGFTDGATGVTWKDDFPRTNYEISLQAQRVDGNDFFCGLTFPVGKDPCSLIVGGWGGTVVGLSSIDGKDASENDTTRYLSFKSKTWYTIRLRVTPARIEAWIDDKQVVDQPLADKKISIRPEVDLSQPLGICSWCTTAAIKDFKYRTFDGKSEQSEE